MKTTSPWADLVLAPPAAGDGSSAPWTSTDASTAKPADGLVFCDVETAVAAIRLGRMIIVTDDEDRENEGDLVMAAVHADATAINFMTLEGRGLVCVPMLPDRLAALDLPPMVSDNSAPFATAFTVPVDARGTTTTGISAHDRAATIAALVDPDRRPTDFVRPGHVFPLAARPGGVLERAGHTEAAIDLARLAGLPPAGVICEILAPDGGMARGSTLAAFARRHGLPVLSIASLRTALGETRQGDTLPSPSTGPWLHLAAEAELPTAHGPFRALAFAEADGTAHVALRLGLGEGSGRSDGQAPLVRIHSECLTGDVFHSLRCDCGAQLDDALAMIAAEGEGLLLYLRQEGRGIGLANKIRAYGLQDAGLDTVDANTVLGLPADARDYSVAAAVLTRLGIEAVRLITNNPAKVQGLSAHGIRVVEQVPRRPALTPENRRYLETKRDRMGHALDLPGGSDDSRRPGPTNGPTQATPGVDHHGA